MTIRSGIPLTRCYAAGAGVNSRSQAADDSVRVSVNYGLTWVT